MGFRAHSDNPSALYSFVLAAVVISEPHSSLSFLNSLWTLRPKNPIRWRWRPLMSTSTRDSVAGGPSKTRPRSKLSWRMPMSLLSSLHPPISSKFMKTPPWTPWLGKWPRGTLISLPALSGTCLFLAISDDKHIRIRCNDMCNLCGCLRD